MKSRFFLLMMVIVLVLSACGPQAPDVIVVTATPEPATATAVPTDTLVPTATATETLVPTDTPVPTPTFTVTPEPICNQAQLVQQGYAEPPAGPGQPIPPETEFTLILRLTNTGACTWTEEYSIVLVGESGLVLEEAQPFTSWAVPGQTVDLEIAIAAPEEAGDYSAQWQLQAPDGEVFGYGATGESAFALDVSVGTAGVGGGFNFITSACSAVWDSNRATYLPCNGGDFDTFIGYIQYGESMNVEGGQRDGQPTINVHPDRGQAGFISGRFPAYTVGIDDHFVAVIGCMENSGDCRVTFELRYRTHDGQTGTLGSWTETGDGDAHFVDMDLSFMAGQTVSFILYTTHTSGGDREQSNAFWQETRIVRAERAVELAGAMGVSTASSDVIPAPPPSSSVCDRAHLLHPVYADVPVYEGTAVHGGTPFTAGWRLTNVGSCTWTAGYEIVLVQQDGVTATSVQTFGGQAAPGESVDVYFELTAPQSPGEYNLIWKLRNPNGEYFGLGPNGTQNLSLNFRVLDLPDGVNFDLTAVHCQAQWHSNKATFLPCNGGTAENIGFVRLIDGLDLESGREPNRPALNVNPDNGRRGYIMGIFPPYTVRNGDRFVTTIGCMDNVEDCSLFFQLRIIKPNGEEAPIGDWVETFDGNTRYVSVNLSQWAGKTIQFVLYVTHYGGRTTHNNGFWMYPHVEGH